MVVHSSPQLSQFTLKCVWATIPALHGRLETPLAQSVSTQLSSQAGAVSSSQASTWLNSTSTRVVKSGSCPQCPHHIAQFSSEPLSSVTRRHCAHMCTLSLLAAELDNFNADMAEYVVIAKGASADEAELGLQSPVRSFTDAAIMAIDFPDRIRMVCTAPLPRVMPQVSGYRPDSPRQIYAPVVFDLLIPQFKRHGMEHLFECRDKPRGFAERRYNFTLCIGPEFMFPDARGIVWDARHWRPDPGSQRGPGIVPYDFTPWESSRAQCIHTHIKVIDLISQLQGHNDKALHSHLQYGSTTHRSLCGNCASWLICCPCPLASCRCSQHCMARLSELGWYEVFTRIPIWPSLMHGQGATARKRTPYFRVWPARSGPGPTHSAHSGSTPRWHTAVLGYPSCSGLAEPGQQRGWLTKGGQGTPS